MKLLPYLLVFASRALPGLSSGFLLTFFFFGMGYPTDIFSEWFSRRLFWNFSRCLSRYFPRRFTGIPSNHVFQKEILPEFLPEILPKFFLALLPGLPGFFPRISSWDSIWVIFNISSRRSASIPSWVSFELFLFFLEFSTGIPPGVSPEVSSGIFRGVSSGKSTKNSLEIFPGIFITISPTESARVSWIPFQIFFRDFSLRSCGDPYSFLEIFSLFVPRIHFRILHYSSGDNPIVHPGLLNEFAVVRFFGD